MYSEIFVLLRRFGSPSVKTYNCRIWMQGDFSSVMSSNFSNAPINEHPLSNLVRLSFILSMGGKCPALTYFNVFDLRSISAK
ncbi:MAG: hypothetical protein U0T36_03600 [Saprospiraceae bacterium]